MEDLKCLNYTNFGLLEQWAVPIKRLSIVAAVSLRQQLCFLCCDFNAALESESDSQSLTQVIQLYTVNAYMKWKKYIPFCFFDLFLFYAFNIFHTTALWCAIFCSTEMNIIVIVVPDQCIHPTHAERKQMLYVHTSKNLGK